TREGRRARMPRGGGKRPATFAHATNRTRRASVESIAVSTASGGSRALRAWSLGAYEQIAILVGVRIRALQVCSDRGQFGLRLRLRHARLQPALDGEVAGVSRLERGGLRIDDRPRCGPRTPE